MAKRLKVENADCRTPTWRASSNLQPSDKFCLISSHKAKFAVAQSALSSVILESPYMTPNMRAKNHCKSNSHWSPTSGNYQVSHSLKMRSTELKLTSHSSVNCFRPDCGWWTALSTISFVHYLLVSITVVFVEYFVDLLKHFDWSTDSRLYYSSRTDTQIFLLARIKMSNNHRCCFWILSSKNDKSPCGNNLTWNGTHQFARKFRCSSECEKSLVPRKLGQFILDLQLSRNIIGVPNPDRTQTAIGHGLLWSFAFVHKLALAVLTNGTFPNKS